jgi:hypothetical protein
MPTPSEFYRAYSNEHPFVREMLGNLNQFGVDGLLKPDGDFRRQERTINDFPMYGPTAYMNPAYPKTEFDFSNGGMYSIYNWEIFFHTISLIARQLRLNNKFAEAIRWLNYVFDPSDPDNPAPNQLYDLRYWQIKPFMHNVADSSIRNMIRLLSATPSTAAEAKLKQDYQAQIAQWRSNPFDPHVIAALRPRAYMLWTVMEYVTTLTDWGDYLFRQDTMESINEAINLYVMASEILGEKPKKVSRPSPPNRNFNHILNNLSAFSNVMVAFENNTPAMEPCTTCDRGGAANPSSGHCAEPPALSTVTDLLFCIPDNPRLMEMWNRVEDRLFKIRHCMNIDGKVRQLALFSPPIDPAMLVRAAAGGLSIEDALANFVAPLPNYRFSYMLQKANEFCGDLKSMGTQLLSLLEKKDGEEAALLRQVHEQNILKASRANKDMAIQEAKQQLATLESSKLLIQIRLDDYTSRRFTNEKENTAIRHNEKADACLEKEQDARLMAGIFGLVPNATLGISGATGTPVTTFTFGGSFLSSVASIKATVHGSVAATRKNSAAAASVYATFQRRQEDWNLQIKSATEELAQVDRQILGTEIRISTAEKELQNHELQVAQSEEMYDWMRYKYTNTQLYSWMINQSRQVYKTLFNEAFTLAKVAQRCLNYELGTNVDLVKHGQWDGARAGLLAGERLSVQLRQLESYFIEHHARELELSKNISLALLNPQALQDLIISGSCEFTLPELLFDLDHPGHYFRRIKTVSLSIPCIVGTYTNVNATLSLTMHGRRDDPGDHTPLVLSGPVAGSIATSSAQNDSGVFELNFRDERYLPFEGRGAVSKWRLDLTQIERDGNETIRMFDFKTISDVIMHLKYTAQDDGALALFKKQDIDDNLSSLAGEINDHEGLLYGISLRHELPNVWHAFKQNGNAAVTLSSSRLPYFIQAMNPGIADLTVIAHSSLGLSAPASRKMKLNASDITLSRYGTTDSYHETLSPAGISFGTSFNLAQDTLLAADIEDLVLIVKLSVS